MNPQEKLEKAKIQLMVKSPFFATVMLRLRHEISEQIPTAGTDSIRIIYNPEFLREITLNQILGVILHEIKHVVGFHFNRCGNRDKKKWNRACDYAINIDVIDEGYELPPNILYNEDYRGMSPEKIYKLIPDEEEFEYIQDILDPGEEQTVAEITGNVKSYISEARQAERNAGRDASKYISREVGLIINPKIDYRSLLQRYANGYAEEDSSWESPNRRYWPELYLPTPKSETITKLTAAFDTSGSVHDDEIKQYLGNVQQIRNIYELEDLTIISADTRIRHIIKVKPGQNLLKIKLNGGGGTRFAPVINHLRINSPTVLLYFTDLKGYFDFEKPNFPVIWINTYDKEKAPEGYGQTICIN